MCFLVNQRWCNDIQLVSTSCSRELETLAINCKPFYSPRVIKTVTLYGNDKPWFTRDITQKLSVSYIIYNRSVGDAVALDLRQIQKHLERPGNYTGILFIDFSSASNTIIPYKLFDKLSLLNVHPAICHWVLNFLLHRPQSVKVNNSLSKPLILNNVAPQFRRFGIAQEIIIRFYRAIK